MDPKDLLYTKEHEWVHLDGNIATVGITDYAQKELGDIVFAELPKWGTVLEQFKEMGSVESVKAVSVIFSPVSGEVIEANQAIIDKPELVNRDAYGEGWLVKIRMTAPSEIEALLSAADYEKYVGAE